MRGVGGAPASTSSVRSGDWPEMDGIKLALGRVPKAARAMSNGHGETHLAHLHVSRPRTRDELFGRRRDAGQEHERDAHSVEASRCVYHSCWA